MGDRARKPSELLARQLRRWREERNLSVQAVANRLAEIGGSLSRVAISKIENGDRGVSLDEWLQLAHALAVPPPLLFLDLESGADVAITPKVALHPWLIWEWVTAETPAPVPAPRGGGLVTRAEEFSRAKTAIFVYRHQKAAANALNRAQYDISRAEYTGDEERLRAGRSAYVEALRALANELDVMVEHGMTPPGKSREWIEKIRELGLSKYPESLVIFEPTGGDDGER